tara:strand:+ start:306 stop:488 length:183 start_codon:yes stop_codon:yes gene_type:complete
MDDKRKAELKRMLGWGSLGICTGIGAIIDNGIVGTAVGIGILLLILSFVFGVFRRLNIKQ